jgi:hypothetical protein
MNVFRRAVPCLFTFVLLTGCASSKVTGYQPMQGEIDRPDRIIVYDFAATAAELPPEVAIAGQGAVSPPATPAQLAVGRRLGAETAKYLVAELQGMGLTAVRAVGQPAPRVGDGLVVGYLQPSIRVVRRSASCSASERAVRNSRRWSGAIS